MACEACNAKFNLFTRKKQCMDCNRYFCSKCVIKRLDKILSCDGCCVLSQRPLLRSSIVQMRSKDLRQYLLAKKVPVRGCIEKEDVINLLLSFANGTADYCNRETTDNVFGTGRLANHLVTDNCERNVDILHQMPGINTRIVDNDIAAADPTLNVYPDGRSDSVVTEEGQISNTSTVTYSDAFAKSDTKPVRLSDINALSELEYLNVKQLKMLLTINRVGYKGCIEKSELLKRASMLWEEYKQSRTKMEVLDENLCKICWDEPIECVILECGHMACCLNCGKQMSECPICKQYVVRVVRFFKA